MTYTQKQIKREELRMAASIYEWRTLGSARGEMVLAFLAVEGDHASRRNLCVVSI